MFQKLKLSINWNEDGDSNTGNTAYIYIHVYDAFTHEKRFHIYSELQLKPEVVWKEDKDINK